MHITSKRATNCQKMVTNGKNGRKLQNIRNKYGDKITQIANNVKKCQKWAKNGGKWSHLKQKKS